MTDKMTFHNKIADYVLGNTTSSNLIDIARSGLEEGFESEALYILSGMNYEDNSFEIKQYFDQMIGELDIRFPSKLDSALSLIKYYLEKLVQNPDDAFDIMTLINSLNYSHNEFWKDSNPELKSEFVGEALGLHHIQTWYRELSDFNDGDRLFYYNDLEPSEQRKKFEEHLLEEATNWLKDFS